MGRRTTTRWLAGLAAAGLLAVSCGGGGDTGGAAAGGGGEQTTGEATGGSFSVQSGEPQALAPMGACYSSECSQIINVLWTGLLSIDPSNSEEILGVAESIDSPDGLVWTVKLKEGWKFHNGEPVDAESFVRAWNYNAYGPNATEIGFFFSPVKGYDALQGKNPKSKEMSGLKVVDPQTIEITLSEAFSQWPLTMSYTPGFAPMAKACLDDLKACNEAPIGNGPYEIDGEWQHNRQIAVTKYADYQGDDPGNADEIVFKIYGSPATAFRDYQAGNLDIVTPDPSQVPQAKATVPEENVLQVDSGSYAYFGFPFYEPAYQDLKIRKALSMAIDREAIIDRILNGLYQPAQDVIAPFVPGSRDDACGENCTYNPEMAKQLWEEAGGVPGNKVTIWFNNDGGHEAWVQAMAKQWQDVLGVDFSFESQPFTPYLASLASGDVDGPYRLGWLPDYPSPENYLNPIYGSGSSNYGKWSGPAHQEFLDLVDEGDAAASVEAGIPAYQEAADVVLRELPVIPLWFGQTFIVFSDNVSNVEYSPLDQLLLTRVQVTG